MRGWVIAVVALVCIFMAVIAAIVGYLLYRPRRRRRSTKNGVPSPDGQVATKYQDPPKNGDVKVVIPDGTESSLPPYSSNDSTLDGKPRDVKVDIDEDSIPEDKGLLHDVKVGKPNERPVDVAHLEQKEPSSSSSSDHDDDKVKIIHKVPSKDSSSSSSDGEGKDKRPGGDGTKDGRTKRPGESSSSSSESSDAEIPKPMPKMKPHIVREDEPHRDSPDLVSDVLAAVDDKHKESSSSSSSSSDDDGKGGKVVVVPGKKTSSSSSSSDDGKIKTAPKPKERRRVPSDEKTPGKRRDSESSSSSSDDGKGKVIPVVAPRTKQTPGSSSSSSSSGDEGKKMKVDVVPPTKRRSKKKKHPKSSSSSSSSDSDGDKKPRDTKLTVVSPRRKSKTSSSSSSDSQAGRPEPNVGVIGGKKDSSTSSSSSSDDSKRMKVDAPLYATPMKKDRKATKAPKDKSSSSSSTSSSSSSSEDAFAIGKLKPLQTITFQSGWGRPVKLGDLYKAGLVDDDTVKGLADGTIPKARVERDLSRYLIGDQPVGGMLIPQTGEKVSIYSAWKRGWIPREACISLLEAQAATGRILDPKTGARYSVEQAAKEGLIDKQVELILKRAERSVYGYRTSSSPEVMSTHQAIQRGHVLENHGFPLLEAQYATGGIIDPNANHRVPINVAYKRSLVGGNTVALLRDPPQSAKGYYDPETNEKISYQDLLKRCEIHPTTGIMLYVLRVDKPGRNVPKEPSFPKPGFSVHTQTERASSSSSTSSSSTSEAEMDISIVTGDVGTQTVNLPDDKKKKRKTPKTERPQGYRSWSIHSSESEREMYRYHREGIPRQGARPFSPPRVGRPVSPHADQATQTLFPPKTKTRKVKKVKSSHSAQPIIITMAEKDVQTMRTSSTYSSTSSSSSSSSDEEETKSPIIHRYEKGIQMTPPSSSSSSESDEEIRKKRVRTQRDVTVKQVDDKLVATGTYVEEKKVTSQTHHEVRTEPEPISVDLGKPEDYYKAEKAMDVSAPPKKIYFTTSWGKQVDLNDLYEARIIDLEMKTKLERGELDPDDDVVVETIKPWITSNRTVAGILHTETGKKYTIFEAAKRGLIRRSTAVALLEAQAATGCLSDPHTGRTMTIEEAQREGFIDGGYEAIIIRAERAVHGYKTQSSAHPLSVFEAMKHGIVVPSHGMQLLEAQLATGGIIDPKAHHRVPLDVAYRRRLFDQHAMNRLNSPTTESKGFVDPNTQQNASYLEIIAKCYKDVDTGVLLFPLETQERGRSPKTASLSSYTSLEVKSPSRSISRDRTGQELLVPKKSSSSTSSSSDEGRKRKTKEIKTASTSIELTKTPAMSGEEDNAFVSTKTIEVETHQRYDPVQFDVEMKQTKKADSSSSSSDDERKNSKEVETTVQRDEFGREITTTTTIVTTTEVITNRRKRSRQDIKFKSGWNRQASLADLFAAGVVTQQTVFNLEEGIIKEEEVEANIRQYLVGAEPIAGILISETGEKISIYTAWKKGLIRRGTSISLLEAQAATGRILDPKTGNRYSVAEASTEGLIDRQFEAVLARAERAVYGYTTRVTPEILSLFQAMKRGIVIENHGIRLLEAQIATGGIIDPNANHRLPVEVAYERGLFDKRINEILEDPSDDTRGFFDPNTEENLTYLELMERCITDTDTGMRLLPLRSHRQTASAKKSKVFFESRTGRQVTISDLVNANRLDTSTAQRIDKGTLTSEERDVLIAKLRVFVDGTMPIAGIINTSTGERMSIYEAAKAELIRRGTAFELLEAQACCGKLIDVTKGKVVTIETALRSGVIDKEFKDVVERAHRAVSGYREPFKRELLSLCEAINRHLVVKRHGIRLLEAQIATGGIIEVKSPVRISPEVALKRALIDSKLAEDLENKRTQSYFDPVTGENLNYSELMGRCVTDKDTGLLYLMVEGGTVTGYVRPFEPEHTSKIRTQSASPGRLTTEEVTTTRSTSATKLGSEVTTTIESSEYVRKKKKKSRKGSGVSTSPASSTGNESTGTESPSIYSRKVVIVDPDTNEEITVRQALKRRLIDKETARQLISQQVEYEEAP